MPKTSKQDFKTFKRAVRYYYKKYKLSGWHIYFNHGGTEHHAMIYPDTDTRAVTFNFGKRWGTKITKKKVKASAKHEVIHLITWPLYSAGWNRFVSKDQLNQLDEEITQHLTELIGG